MSIKNIVILCIYGCLIVGCGSIEKKQEDFNEQSNAIISTEDNSHPHIVKNVLYEKYRKWQGVRYRFGGLSQNGIDCSGFVHVVYKTGLGKDIPRTTVLQLKAGKEINKNDLKAGDLVFFRTNRSNHVGIYLENKKFIHASQTRGVTISRLDNFYWQSKYWKSVRI